MRNPYQVIGSLYGVLALGLVGAKMTGFLHWSWWLILSPVWMPICLAVVCIIGVIAILGSASANGRNPFN
jgi:ABC-type antimicrobial peptide transport system permease subunit